MHAEQVKTAELARRLAEEQQKVADTEVARATAESLNESLMNQLTWLREYGIIEVILETWVVKHLANVTYLLTFPFS